MGMPVSRVIYILALMCIAATGWCESVSDIKGATDRTFSVAHRSCRRHAPENSIAAIEDCIRLGITMTEIDVRRAADGTLVLMHDETIDRTTNGGGRVDELRLEEIREYRLLDDVSAPSAGESNHVIPTLAEALSVANGNIILCLDIKEDIYKDVLADVHAVGAQDFVIFLWLQPLPALADSSLLTFLNGVHIKPTVQPDIASKKIRKPMIHEILQSYLTIDPVALTVSAKRLPRLNTAVDVLHENNVLVWVTTLREERHSRYANAEKLHAYWASLVDRGVNIIQTDRPEELVSFLGAYANAQ